MLASFRRDKRAQLILGIVLAYLVWWHFLDYGHIETEGHVLDWFAGTYGVIALIGGLCGVVISNKWGGFKSVLGRAILMFSLGLLAQEFGQLTYAYYIIVKAVEIPYPSIGDIGYFGSVLLYIYGTVLLARAAGTKFSLKDVGSKVLAIGVPAILLVSSYLFFLKGYEFDSSAPLITVLDLGYPLGQAIYIAIAIVAFLLSRKMLGGVMRGKILLIILALCAQYAADFNFLFQANRETWITAGYGDILYMVSYALMAFALFNISTKSLSVVRAEDPIPTTSETSVN